MWSKILVWFRIEPHNSAFVKLMNSEDVDSRSIGGKSNRPRFHQKINRRIRIHSLRLDNSSHNESHFFKKHHTEHTGNTFVFEEGVYPEIGVRPTPSNGV